MTENGKTLMTSRSFKPLDFTATVYRSLDDEASTILLFLLYIICAYKIYILHIILYLFILCLLYLFYLLHYILHLYVVQ